jgi:hypothetical protein
MTAQCFDWLVASDEMQVCERIAMRENGAARLKAYHTYYNAGNGLKYCMLSFLI